MAVHSARSAFDRELSGLQAQLLRLGAMVDSAIARTLQALSTHDQQLAQQVIDDDAQVNALRFQIEEECITLIATQQPAARDLRTIVATMNIDTEFERMADHAAGIARIVLRIGNEPLLKPLIDIPRMAHECREMINLALEAYVRHDVDLARAVAARDDTVDALYAQVFRELLSYMIEDPSTITHAMYLLFVSHNLERIGDRATNVAERVIFMTSGELRELNPIPKA